MGRLSKTRRRHARYGGDVALIVIASGDVYAGSLPPRALRLVREWVEERRAELEVNWHRAQAHEPLEMDRTAFVNELIDIIDVRPLEDRWVRLWFSDGSIKDVDLAPVLERGGVFAPMRDDRDRFCDVRINQETGTIEWPGDVDLDPLVLYGLHEPATGPPLTRRDVTPATSP
jgi:Protein of unknown function (DUF2442)/Domain of unknown function (DUF4160)